LKRLIGLLSVIVIASVFTTGCAINRATATVDPSARLDTLRTLQVKKLEGEDGTVHKLIADKLRARGYQVTTDSPPPAKVDAVVTYVDKWMWDITMYLLELTITIRDPGTDYPLANGNSYHTSLSRKSPPDMVDEVLGNIFTEAGKKQ
jgi:hypothetical protein